MEDTTSRLRDKPYVFFGCNDKKAAIRAIKMITSELMLLGNRTNISIDNNEVKIVCTDLRRDIYNKQYEPIRLVQNFSDLNNITLVQCVCEEFYYEIGVNKVIKLITYRGQNAIQEPGDSLEASYNTEHIMCKFTLSKEVFEYNNIELEDLKFITFS